MAKNAISLTRKGILESLFWLAKAAFTSICGVFGVIIPVIATTSPSAFKSNFKAWIPSDIIEMMPEPWILWTLSAACAIAFFVFVFMFFRSKAMSDRDNEANQPRRPLLTLDGIRMKNVFRGVDATGSDVDARNMTFEDVVEPFVIRDTPKDRN